MSALGERIGTWFEERPRLLHRKAEEEDVAVEASGSEESEQDIEEE